MEALLSSPSSPLGFLGNSIFVAALSRSHTRSLGMASLILKNQNAMPNTYTQLYTHLVFAVKNRQALIEPKFREEIERYMTGILQNKKHKLLAIYLMTDHAHILIGTNPAISLSDTVQVLKIETTNFIKEKCFTPVRFNWQEGFGAFSHSRNELDNVVKYILNQPEHHRKATFQDEYIALLQRYEIDYKDEYLFDFFEH
jgi:REP element-mobilizing transposase RayT